MTAEQRGAFMFEVKGFAEAARRSQCDTRRLCAAAVLGIAASIAAPTACKAAESYPQRPLRIIVPQAAGSSTDFVTRLVAHELTARIGQQVVVDARPGAGGTIGAGIAAKASPDGYTLLMANVSTHAINPWLYENLPYEPISDFAPVSMIATGPYMLLVRPQLGVASVKDLIAMARAKPGELNYASGGNGTGTHLAGEMLKLKANVQIAHVPYKGSAPGLTDLIGGQVSLMFIGIPPALPHVKAGRLRALAVTGEKRAEVAADIPTMSEAGIPGYGANTWFAVLAPAGTHARIVERPNAELIAITKALEIRQKFEAIGMDAINSSPRACADFMRAEIRKWGEVIKASGARIQ